MNRTSDSKLVMDEREVEMVLASCERALGSGGRPDLRALRFWRAVAAVKDRPEWTSRFATRIGEIDRRAFLGRTWPVFPIGAGVILLVLGTLAGFALLSAAFTLEPTAAGIAVVVAAGALVGTTHDLAHLLVGSAVGIRFTHWYADLPRRPQPGVKIDYGSYLAAPPRARALMHASGAIVSKLVPFVLVPVAVAAGTPRWTAAILITLGAVQLATDLLFSLRSGDWKKFRREMRYARRGTDRSG